MPFDVNAAGAEQLQTASDWLGMQLSLAPENVTTVGIDHGAQQSTYARIFARHYNDLVGMDGPDALVQLYDGVDPRHNGSFLVDVMRTHNCKTIIDTCSGCQYDILYLLGAAARGEIDVQRLASNEVDDALLEQGRRNIEVVRKARGIVPPEITRHPWQQLSAAFGAKAFDVGLCMGNSISHLSDPVQRRLCIRNFAEITKKLFIIDTRNFHQMLVNPDALREQARNFLSAGPADDAGNRVLFPGSIANFPVFISPERVIVAYVRHGERSPYALVEFSPLLMPTLLAELRLHFSTVDVWCDRKQCDKSDLEVLKAADGPRTLQFICA